MNGELIKKSIAIKAPREKVWNVLIDDACTRVWYAEFSEGTHAETDWNVGSKALFTDSSGSGLLAKVAVNKPNEMLSVSYEGIINSGKEDYESDIARQVKGGHETYWLKENNGNTYLEIECTMAPEMIEQMSEAWEKALEKVRELAEKN
jgi:uncharacterized protein YndB with AHSA1/START domain